MTDGTGLALTIQAATVQLAQASQGPGTAPGTASALLQIAMAIGVYGLCAATVMAAVVLKLAQRA